MLQYVGQPRESARIQRIARARWRQAQSVYQDHYRPRKPPLCCFARAHLTPYPLISRQTAADRRGRHQPGFPAQLLTTESFRRMVFMPPEKN